MAVNIIAAHNKHGVIGKDGKVPWYIPKDLKRFKKLTIPHPVIMGRKTHESIGKLLKRRTNIIISRSEKYIPIDVSESVFVARSLELAIEVARQEDEEIFIIGGSEIYNSAIPLADKMYLTVVNNYEEGDIFFPQFDVDDWEIFDKEEHFHECTFVTLIRKR